MVALLAIELVKRLWLSIVNSITVRDKIIISLIPLLLSHHVRRHWLLWWKLFALIWILFIRSLLSESYLRMRSGNLFLAAVVVPWSRSSHIVAALSWHMLRRLSYELLVTKVHLILSIPLGWRTCSPLGTSTDFCIGVRIAEYNPLGWYRFAASWSSLWLNCARGSVGLWHGALCRFQLEEWHGLGYFFLTILLW